ncbi:MAG TPA: tripartite tricarboxylate transporter substrate binding protein BugE [Usitatibacter sp.]|nr:tripartite tricarboxylate transporter substrate binding protein BugE [Usitatibacter sp.]
MNTRHASTAGILAALVALAAIAADTYPSRPVRLVVPFAPGGTTDIVARVTSAKIQAAFGQPMVVENRAGAGGVIGATETAKAAPDGYSLGVATVSTIATAPAMEPTVTYDPINDFTPIINIAATPNVITVNPQFPARDFAGFIAELKKNPDKYSYASTGTGSITHMQMELFKAKTGVSIVHIPYKGAGPALTDEIAGHVLVMLDNLPSSLPYIQQGKLIPIVVASEKRVPALPNVPTLAEVGVPEANRMAFYGIYGPKGLPADVVAKVHDAVKKTLEDREVRERIEATGSVVIANTPAEFAKQIKSEFETYKKLAIDQKLKPE